MTGGGILRSLEGALRHERALIAAFILVLVALSTAYTITGVGMNLSAIEMTFMQGSDIMREQPAGPRPEMAMTGPAPWTVAEFVLVFLMWWVMMIAMMLPSTAPAVLLYAALTMRRAEKGQAVNAGFPPCADWTGRSIRR